MKKILIVIHDMKIGGAQKSLLTFLKCLASSPAGKDLDVSVMPIAPDGAFYGQIPEQITVIEPPRPLLWLGSPFRRQLVTEKFSLRGLLGEICWLIGKKLHLFPEKLNLQQQLWQCWRRWIPKCTQEYDVAVSYMDGVPNYYVMDKVRASKKVLWVHNEYEKLQYDPEYDMPYYESCNQIITISDQCLQCLAQAFEQQKNKMQVLANITSAAEVLAKAEQGTCPEFADQPGLKLLSVGRLSPQKRFDLAVETAKRLKDAGVDFLWLILGEGAERTYLQETIDREGLSEQVYLLGVRENPYAYMKQCDIVVQTSRAEGKSIVLDEAKILCKPIVTTNYTTVRDSVTHGENGWVVEMTPQAVCDGILQISQNTQLREHIIQNLLDAPKGNEKELEMYIQTMF